MNTNELEDEYIITQIHKWAIKYCLSKYGLILDYNSSVFHEDAINNINEIGEETFIKRILEKELSEVFVDRNIRLLKLLKSLITNEFDTNQKNISLFGTRNFEIIWEKVCSKVFKNDIENKAPLPYEQKSFKDNIKRPIWSDDNTGEGVPKETIIPDIVCVNYSRKSFFIIDAKYYNTRFESSPTEIQDNSGVADVSKQILQDNPGVADVSKQILYEHAFRDIFDKEFLNWYNILVFPKLGISDLWEIYGTVKFGLNIFMENTVWLMYFSPNKIYSNYLNNSAWGEIQLNLIADTIDNRIISNTKKQS